MVSKPVLVVSVCCAFGFGMVGMLTVMVSPVLPVVSTWLGWKRDPVTSISLRSQDSARISSQDGARSRIATETSSREGTVRTARSPTPSATSSYGNLLFVAYLSAPSNVKRRAAVRDKCFPSIRAAGYDVKFS